MTAQADTRRADTVADLVVLALSDSDRRYRLRRNTYGLYLDHCTAGYAWSRVNFDIALSDDLAARIGALWTKRPSRWRSEPEMVGTRTLAGLIKALGGEEAAAFAKQMKQQKATAKMEAEKWAIQSARWTIADPLKQVLEKLERCGDAAKIDADVVTAFRVAAQALVVELAQ